MTTPTSTTARPPAPISSAGGRHTRAILGIVLISYFMILLDNSIIFTALPKIHTAMHYSSTGLAWVQDAYTLVFGGLLLLGARAGDLLGRRRVFVFGLAVFALASLLVGIAPTGWWLIAARALQGVGAAIVAPSSLSLLTASFPQGEGRAKAIALYGATAGIGASLGLVIGGALADWVSWRAGFFLNVPIGAAMIVLAPRYLPETVRRRGHFDLVGAVSATIGVGAVVFSIIHSADSGWTSPVTVATLAAGAMLLLGLVASERRAAQPIMPLGLFGSRERVGAYLARLLYLGAMIGFFYYITQYLQAVLGFSAFAAGVAFFPMTVVNFAVAMAIPRLTARVGQAAPLAAGVALTLAGMVWLSRVHTGSSYWEAVALPMLLIGAGQGLAFAPMTSAGIAGVGAEDAGAASGLVNTFHQLGMALGLGVLIAASAHAGHNLTSPAAVLTAHVNTALATGSVLLALCLVVTLALIVPVEPSARPPRHNRSRCCGGQACAGRGGRCPGLASTRRRRDRIMQKLTAPATAKGSAETFTGEVWFDQIYRGDQPARARVNAVHFTPGARTNWHVHAVGQTLPVTEGTGIVATRDGTVIVMRPATPSTPRLATGTGTARSATGS